MVKGDSRLVVKQVNREWKTKSEAMRRLRTQAEELLALFETWRVEWIPRKENRRADELGRTQQAQGPCGAVRDYSRFARNLEAPVWFVRARSRREARGSGAS